MMLVSSLTPPPEDKVIFNYSALRDTPEYSGCYVLTTYDGIILYIGKSIKICARMEQHLDKNDKKEKTPWGIAFWLYYMFCCVRDIDNLENGWCNDYKIKEGMLPFFNKIHPPI